MNNRIKLYLLLVLINLTSFNLNSQIATTIFENGKSITIVNPLLSDSTQIIDNRKIINYIGCYVLNIYNEVCFPIHIIIEPTLENNFPYEITFNNYFGSAFEISKDEFLLRQKESSSIEKIGIKIYTDKNIVNTLKLIDYGIKNKKQLSQKFWKLRKEEDPDIKDIEKLVIESPQLNNILNTSNKRINMYIENNPF